MFDFVNRSRVRHTTAILSVHDDDIGRARLDADTPLHWGSLQTLKKNRGGRTVRVVAHPDGRMKRYFPSRRRSDRVSSTA